MDRIEILGVVIANLHDYLCDACINTADHTYALESLEDAQNELYRLTENLTN